MKSAETKTKQEEQDKAISVTASKIAELVETEKKARDTERLQQVTSALNTLAKEARADMAENKRLVLAAADVILSFGDLIDEDTIGTLKTVQQVLGDEIKAAGPIPAGPVPERDDSDLSTEDIHRIDAMAEECWKMMGAYRYWIVRKVLEKCTS